jgi:hypothetical protein
MNSAVRDNLLALGGGGNVISKSASYSILLTDFSGGTCTCLVDSTGGSDVVITLPAASIGAGFSVTVVLAAATVSAGKSTGLCLISPAGSETANGITTDIPLYLKWDYVTVTSDGSNWVIASEKISLFAEYSQGGGAQTYVTNTWAQNVYDTAAVDTASCLTGGGFVIPTGMAGYYDLSCIFRWQTPTSWSTSPAGFHQLFKKNGDNWNSYVTLYQLIGRPTFVFQSQPLLAAGDDIEVWAKQVTGGDMDTTTSSQAHVFWARLVRRTYA